MVLFKGICLSQVGTFQVLVVRAVHRQVRPTAHLRLIPVFLLLAQLPAVRHPVSIVV